MRSFRAIPGKGITAARTQESTDIDAVYKVYFKTRFGHSTKTGYVFAKVPATLERAAQIAEAKRIATEKVSNISNGLKSSITKVVRYC